jgi:hypothetical protein
VRAADGLLALWPENTEVLGTGDLSSNPQPGWSAVEAPLSEVVGEQSLSLYSAQAVGSDLVVGWSTRAFTAGLSGLEGLVEPRFTRMPVQPSIFSDGFEAGDMMSWSASTP